VSATVSVQASPRDRDSWLAIVDEVEKGGFETLYVSDHPGSAPSPFVALAAAASVTEHVRLGTCVLNAGVWEPVALASAVATLDVLSDGRAVLGVGAGHTPNEWTSTGRVFPSPGARVARMAELVDMTRALLRGEAVSSQTHDFALMAATMADPHPVQSPVPLMVGGNGARVLTFAAQHADIVGITGLARTLADGHRHEVDWSRSGVEHLVEIVHRAAEQCGRSPQLEALVQHVEITNDASAAANRLAEHIDGASPEDLLTAPFVWIGTVDEIRRRLHEHHASLGLQRYVVRSPAIDDVLEVLESPPS
jgi:probable F420-dependent oxidoreductase